MRENEGKRKVGELKAFALKLLHKVMSYIEP